MNTVSEKKEQTADIEQLFAAGAHYGYRRTRRHPSTEKFIYGVKNGVEIFDLEKTSEKLEEAKNFVRSLGESGKQILFVSSKPQVRQVVVEAAASIEQPVVTGRWIGGSLTNLKEIEKRLARLAKLREGKESGEWDKYTKHERLLLDREIEELENRFGGLVKMRGAPTALFVVDPKEEETAVREARHLSISVVALAGNDCDITGIAHPIPGNDSTIESVQFFVSEIAAAYKEGMKAKKETPEKTEKKVKEEATSSASADDRPYKAEPSGSRPTPSKKGV